MRAFGTKAFLLLGLELAGCLAAPEKPPKLTADAAADARVGAADQGRGPDGFVRDARTGLDGRSTDATVSVDGAVQTDGPSTGGSSADARVQAHDGSAGSGGSGGIPVDATYHGGSLPDATEPADIQPPDAGHGECEPRATEPCGTDVGECIRGERTCTENRTWGSCEGGVGPSDEICNGLDDDCDGQADEELTQPCGIGAGACEFGVQRCEGGLWGECNEAAGPQAEVCDGVDNDCDGETDEDYQPVMECGVGACALDAVPSVCEGGVEVPCQPGVPAPDDTTCDGVDNDCDGSVDEDYSPTRGCGIGACAAAAVASSCIGGVERPCEPGLPAGAESACDGIDEDCDGSVDEGICVHCVGGGEVPCNGCDAGTVVPTGWVCAPPGSFAMGSIGGPEGQHQVTISYSFLVSSTEVTRSEWLTGTGQPLNGDCLLCPVTNVSWLQSLSYANLLSEAEGRTRCYDVVNDSDSRLTVGLECDGYRIPTEAEWEYFARAGIVDDVPGDVSRFGWDGDNSENRLHPVGELLPNAWGIVDVLGNAGEWTFDGYQAYAGDSVDPVVSGLGSGRTRRGGGYSTARANVRLPERGYRSNVDPLTEPWVGLRIVRTIRQ